VGGGEYTWAAAMPKCEAHRVSLVAFPHVLPLQALMPAQLSPGVQKNEGQRLVGGIQLVDGPQRIVGRPQAHHNVMSPAGGTQLLL